MGFLYSFHVLLLMVVVVVGVRWKRCILCHLRSICIERSRTNHFCHKFGPNHYSNQLFNTHSHNGLETCLWRFGMPLNQNSIYQRANLYWNLNFTLSMGSNWIFHSVQTINEHIAITSTHDTHTQLPHRSKNGVWVQRKRAHSPAIVLAFYWNRSFANSTWENVSSSALSPFVSFLRAMTMARNDPVQTLVCGKGNEVE